MHLESLTTGDTNLRQLTLEDPQRREDPRFDPARYLRPRDWELFRKILEQTKRKDSWEAYVEQISLLSILGKKIRLQEKTWNTIAARIMYAQKRIQTDYGCALFLRVVAELTSLGRKPFIAADTFHVFSSFFENIRRGTDQYKTIGTLCSGIVLGMQLHLSSDEWDTIETHMEKDLEAPPESGKLEFSFLSLAVPARIVQHPVPRLEQKHWQYLLGRLDEELDQERETALQLAARMAILAADDVRLENGSLYLIRRPKVTPPVIDHLPTVRNFISSI